MAQQTAVEWLIEQLKLLETSKAEWFNETSTINKALRIEKEHIMMAYNDGKTNAGLKLNKKSIEYYNETYNK